ncbi:hypothetical protein B0H15DRAFT_916002 [Mycena belliarum]|uniref:Uncharacterized protein n=1 Tax=Mycena belliarum TaxID=1033014 RepID=A0AAD6XN34_9AGAR|nr:hypothetical protein B0H15DRAFT_916002 [Mycena belliae]
MNFPRQTEPVSSSAPPSSSPISAALAPSQSSDSQGRQVSDSDSASLPPNSDAGSASSTASASTSAVPSPASSSSASAKSDPPASSASSRSASISDAPSSSSASARPSSSSAPPSSSATFSANPSSITPTASSLSESAAPSTSFTTIVTSIDGHGTTITSALSPTSLSTATASATTARRTAIIAGATAAGVGLVLLLLGAIFIYKRHKSRKLEFSEAIGRVRREAHGAGGVGLLDEEGFDDEDGVPMHRYRDNAGGGSRSMNMSEASLGKPQSPAPSLFRNRAPETGSLFREEGVWPPPQGTSFVDPLVGVGSGDGLARIVDDVMGPANPALSHAKSNSNSSPAYTPRPSADSNLRPPIPTMSSATTSLYADPFRDISHTSQPSDPSLYFDRRGASSSMSSDSHTTHGSRPTTPQSLLGLPAGAAPAPKKPSPLAAAANQNSSATWLNRSPRKHNRLSGSQTSAEG